MVSGLDMFSKEELVSYATTLLQQAIRRLETEEPDSVAAAAWRIADALGALSSAAEEDVMGIHYPTGLGYCLKVNDDNTQPVQKVE